METVMGECDVPEQQSSFGVKKIVDCKIGKGGQQMYKVEWEATWEPAESLVSCQHLVDEFWSFINIAKAKEEVAKQHRKRMHLQQGMNNIMNTDQNFNRLTDGNKAEVQRLITHTNATSVGDQMLRSPSNILMASPQHNQQSNLMGMTQTPTHLNNQNFPTSSQIPQNMTSKQNHAIQMPSPGQKSLDFSSIQQQQNLNSPGQKGKFTAFRNTGNTPTPVKAESNDSTEQIDAKQYVPDSKSAGTASLKYLESFSNPYVKIIVVCKVCNKEQSLKFASYWRQHYMTHQDTKPHQCPHCPKTFTRPVLMRKHVQSKHGNVTSAVNPQHMSMVAPKHEHMMAQDDVKEEDYLY